eukprot:CAMPEP_0115611396 /NCGR_PEP_ID=MMETSP0272-20121206/20512_1 /TAXON_ID=71861 /ORGANISM="Scrippsiella trochoidea, Strain CCMP3099" /LENGTH=115 /DNA_ID=CAMNT_0003047129 /DNA_START=36 /DNA_END=384 /DNA_ORIENTATION=+
MLAAELSAEPVLSEAGKTGGPAVARGSSTCKRVLLNEPASATPPDPPPVAHPRPSASESQRTSGTSSDNPPSSAAPGPRTPGQAQCFLSGSFCPAMCLVLNATVANQARSAHRNG